MKRIAVTGHRGLGPETVRLVDVAVRRYLGSVAGGVVGVSCLADGADTIFARAVLDQGGVLEVVIPAERYRDGLPEAHREVYDELLNRASVVRRLEFEESTSASHMRASELIVEGADLVLAVWDGQPARGYGGTADVVAFVRERGVPVEVIWPDGTLRD